MAKDTEETKTKSYALSKTKVKEMLTEAFGSDTNVTVSLAAVLALFESSAGSVGGTTVVYNDKGEVIGRRCSYFGVYMDIAEFGKRGDTYSYQCKTAESIGRKQRTEAVNAKKLVDEELSDEVITLAEWKQKLADIKTAQEAKIEISSLEVDFEYYETAEDLKAALA